MEFHIGQDVVCVKTHSQGIVKEGQQFVVKALREGCCAATPLDINVGVTLPTRIVRCADCGSIWEGDFICASLFRPLDEIADISELTEVLDEPIFNVTTKQQETK